MQQDRTYLHGAPALLTYAHSAEQAAARGTILFYHGFTASKESGQKEFYSLASRGFLVVGLDNVGHGARRYPDFEVRFGTDNAHAWEHHFLEAVRSTADETPRVIDALLQRGLAHPDHLGISGISMGGYITYGAVLRDRRLRVAAPILGSPVWKAPDSPHRRPEQFFPVALLSQTAGRDRTVLPQYARDFHWHLGSHYHASPDRQRYIEFPNSEHMMNGDEWDQLWENVLRWFEAHL